MTAEMEVQLAEEVASREAEKRESLIQVGSFGPLFSLVVWS
jgi:hypothetical protein